MERLRRGRRPLLRERDSANWRRGGDSNLRFLKASARRLASGSRKREIPSVESPAGFSMVRPEAVQDIALKISASSTLRIPCEVFPAFVHLTF